MTLEKLGKLKEPIKKSLETLYQLTTKPEDKGRRSHSFYCIVEDGYDEFLAIVDLAIESGIKTGMITVSRKDSVVYWIRQNFILLNWIIDDRYYIRGRKSLPEKVDNFEHAHVFVPGGTLCYYAKCYYGHHANINCDWDISWDTFLTFEQKLRDRYRMKHS
jgi:hypothetical protein